METLDAWTNVIASPGKRTTGTAAQDIAVVGPGWHGQMPPGIAHTYISPTNNVWIINRIQANGQTDYPTVNALQRQITATPLSGYGKPYTPPPGTVEPNIDSKTPPGKQVNAMSADEFFTTLARALAVNQPSLADSAIIKRMATIGIAPGQDFSMARKSAAVAKEIRAGAKLGLESIEKHSKTMASIKNGWQTLDMCGDFGTDYLTRAGGRRRWAWLQPAGRCPLSGDDGRREREAAHGHEANTCSHFEAGKTPPANAFWFVTMYDATFFLVNNAEPIRAQLVRQHEEKRRRLARSVRAARVAWRGQAGQLAPSPRRQVRPHAAHVLAEA